MRVKRKQLLILAVVLSVGIFLFGGAQEQIQEEWTPSIVINEVAWSGTLASYADEWIELYNTTDEDIDLSGWVLTWGEGDVTIYFAEAKGNTKEVRRSIVPAQSFYLLERTDDMTISDLEADLIYKGALDNAGEILILKDAEENIIDTANIDGKEWPAGTGRGDEPPYASMERLDPLSQDSPENWGTNDGLRRNGLDAEGNPINGTPGEPNSTWPATP